MGFISLSRGKRQKHTNNGDISMRTAILQAPLFSVSGYGAYSRDVFRALLLSTPYRVCGVPVKWGFSSEVQGSDDFSKALAIACKTRPDKTEEGRIFLQVCLPKDFTPYNGCINIGITGGLEVDSLSEEEVISTNRMDALIVPSIFTAEQFKAGGLSIPMFVVGQGVDVATFRPLAGRPTSPALDKIDTPFNFLTGGEWFGNNPAEIDRKGIGETIRVFLDTFPDSKEVGLVVKAHTFNNSSSDEHLTAKKIAALKQGKEFPRVYLIHGRLSDEEMAALYNDGRIKAFVSPTHGESWGRMIAESVSCDLPVIIGGWGGHMDYIDPKKATILGYKLETVPNNVRPLYPAGAKWANSDPTELKRFMLRCHRKYSGAAERAEALGIAFRQKLSESITRSELARTVIKIAEGK